MPDAKFQALWHAIYVDSEIKEQLLCQALLNFSVRSQVDRAVLPLHGILLLIGPPGTGKTSLAKGLADQISRVLPNLRYLEVEPHSLASSAHGKTQKAVVELFSSTIGEQAALGPTFGLLDEVETIVADRSKLSLEANPVDVHRATDAALVQLDHLAEQYPNLLIVATSNFPKAIDEAFKSRCDLVVTVPLPNAEACEEILRSTVEGMSNTFHSLRAVLKDPELKAAAKACVGLDGRQIRKLVAAACTFDRQVALDPGKMTAAMIHKAAKRTNRGEKA
jgi:SpoVK/Ycf46/Vps4 family AAA+-type ATPase